MAGIAQSVYRLATGWTVRRSNPGGGEIFRTRPDLTWGPPSHSKMGTGSFPGVKRLGSGADHPSPSSAEFIERLELHLYSPSGSSWLVIGWNLPLTFKSHTVGIFIDQCMCVWRKIFLRLLWSSVRNFISHSGPSKVFSLSSSIHSFLIGPSRLTIEENPIWFHNLKKFSSDNTLRLTSALMKLVSDVRRAIKKKLCYWSAYRKSGTCTRTIKQLWNKCRFWRFLH